MTKRVTVRIRPDGSIEAETQGMQGPECLPYIETLERLTGSRAVDSWYTDEFFETQLESQPGRQEQSDRTEVEDSG